MESLDSLVEIKEFEKIFVELEKLAIFMKDQDFDKINETVN